MIVCNPNTYAREFHLKDNFQTHFFLYFYGKVTSEDNIFLISEYSGSL